MINKIVPYFRNLSKRQISILEKLNELKLIEQENTWAHVFHNSIKGKDYIEQLPLNIGRWAGGYPFFYVLHRILSEFKPESIIEFGLGESTKLISTYLDKELLDSSHTVIEHDKFWIQSFQKRFKLSERVKIICCPLTKKNRFGFEVNSYEDLLQKINRSFNLYIIDGPFGSPRYSRYDIVDLLEKNITNENFIIIFDDYNRVGELDTFLTIKEIFKNKNIPINIGYYKGEKTVAIITSENNRFFTSM